VLDGILHPGLGTIEPETEQLPQNSL
jgi:hypothetical protein